MDKKLRHERILDCRYYNGEDECPQGINGMFWFYECFWVNHENEDYSYADKELKRLGLENFEGCDGTPYELKCLFYNRFEHWNGIFTPDEFLNWYKTQYQQPRTTNRQRRAESRRPKLIAQCRYYGGENENPYKGTDFEKIWYYESCWVEDLSLSYRNAEPLYWHLRRYPGMTELAKKHKVPCSLLGLFINRYEYCHSMGEVCIDVFKDWVENVYLKTGKKLQGI